VHNIKRKQENDWLNQFVEFFGGKKTGEVGYDLNPKHQNIGIMSETLNCIVNFGFNTLNLNKIEAFTHHSNESSKRLLTKQNFEYIKHRADEDNADNIIYELKKAST
jgi:ribosomal-protein-alanine N-acetyltransferase